MKTAIYLRVSTSDQTHESQEREVMAYAQRAGWPNLELYRDIASGSTKDRPELAKMLSDARAGRLERILAYKLDRVGRSVLHLTQIINELKSLRVPIIFTSQGISTENSNPVSDLFLNIMSSIAEFERGQITDRVRAGLAAAKARGVRMGKPPLSGTVKNMIWQKVSAGDPPTLVAKSLNVGLSTVYKVVNEYKKKLS